MEENNLKRIKENFENGTILISDLNESQIELLTNYYRTEIEKNKNDMKEIREKMLALKNKIDNIV